MLRRILSLWLPLLAAAFVDATQSPDHSTRPPSARRVLIVSFEYPPLGGGGGVIFRDFAEELAQRVEVTVLTSDRAGLPASERRSQLEIVRVPVLMRNSDATASLASMLSFFPASLGVGRRLLRKRPYDLVHSSFAVPSGPSGLLLAREFGLPHVLSLHGGDIYDPTKLLSPHHTPFLKQTVRWVIRKSDRVVAQSSDTARRARSIYVERDVDRIPLAIKPIPFERRERSQLGLRAQDKVLITIGRLVARKGLDQLLRVVARLEDPNWQLLIVGHGPQREALEAECRKLGLSERVRFTGFVSEEEKWQLLAVSDLYVSTTLHEGFGIVFLEAMEVGLPVLAYDKGGQVDFVNERVGQLVPVGDEDAFRRSVDAHLRDDVLRARKGAAARELAREFHNGRFADRYESVYAECLAQRGASLGSHGAPIQPHPSAATG
jgi:glycosyltransferase involved in cell wall biosynthesis